MDFLSLSKTNRLFWLGRYNERVFTTIDYLMERLDMMVDGEPLDFAGFCAKIGISGDYPDAMSFMRGYLFEDTPGTLLNAAGEMLGNGMVLRETISSHALAYLQMALTTMETGRGSEAPGLILQNVVDDIMAFRGACENFIYDDAVYFVIRLGASVERLSLYGRLDTAREHWQQELYKLAVNLEKTHIRTDAYAYAKLEAFRHADDPADIDGAEMAKFAESLVIL